MSKKDFNRSRWMRAVIIQNPEIGIDELVAKYNKERHPAAKRPDQQNLYQVRSQLVKRWNLESIESVPFDNGKVDLSALLQRYFEHHGDSSNEKIKKFFDTDGLVVKDEVIDAIRKEGNFDSPDANQNSGPRAGAPVTAKKAVRSIKNKLSTAGVELLYRTKEYVDEVGGIDQAKCLIECLEELQSKR